MGTDLPFSSRRSPVLGLNGCVASSQPLASAVGLDVLKRGGNAADAAVAIAAALAVTEPCSTGLGGDAFCLFYNGNTREIQGINGSGRSPRALTLDFLEGLGYSAEAPPSVFDALNVTVPGAPACWCDTVQLFGSKKLSMQEVLSGAVVLAEEGFPVGDVTAHHWAKCVSALGDSGKKLGGDLLISGQPPKHGQIFKNTAMAQTIKELSEGGKPAFYQGRVAKAIVDVINQNGGVMTLEDLRGHDSEVVSPISTEYKGVRLWELPPNGQGLVALLLLNILENFPQLKAGGHNRSDYIHVFAEAVRLAQTDAFRYLGDPTYMTVPLESLLAKSYSQQRARHISMDRVTERVKPGLPTGSDTVYFCVIDSQGNACSFVNSNYMGFGTGLVPKDCGFSLQRLEVGRTLKQPFPQAITAAGGSPTACACGWHDIGLIGVISRLRRYIGAIQRDRVYAVSLPVTTRDSVHLPFLKQNRGANFSLQRGHINCVAGGKRPYHTIIPALLTDSLSGSEKPQLLAALGVMGGFMQPQGHVQVLLNMVEFGMNPQQALDAPRVFVQYDDKTDEWLVNLEEGIDKEVAVELRRKGHRVNWPVKGHERAQFGRGQIIAVRDWWNHSVPQTIPTSRVLWGGSDPRADGCAQGY